MSWCRSDQITSRYVWGRMRGDTLGSEEETFPDVSAALRRGIVKEKDRIYVRWTLGQTGHGWRSGLDGDWEWSLPLPTCLRVHVQGQGQGAAASPLSIEIRRILAWNMDSRTLRGICFRNMSRGNVEITVETSPASKSMQFRVSGNSILPGFKLSHDIHAPLETSLQFPIRESQVYLRRSIG
ncbi:hypothetical protein NA56DRAFT_694146 [Hyaloscypha hepaticicola]|uniref:Uncharacterized protein n=1 Tax=Hyaloscypha hepaticicola TaxID=2082293 RepID=A0A2J6PJY9_9HELO|nr:hypothetical protein NA56DRAFT_694146 [Hyaloscypha hepaticicola]